MLGTLRRSTDDERRLRASVPPVPLPHVRQGPAAGRGAHDRHLRIAHGARDRRVHRPPGRPTPTTTRSRCCATARSARPTSTCSAAPSTCSPASTSSPTPTTSSSGLLSLADQPRRAHRRAALGLPRPPGHRRGLGAARRRRRVRGEARPAASCASRSPTTTSRSSTSTSATASRSTRSPSARSPTASAPRRRASRRFPSETRSACAARSASAAAR